MSKKKKEWVSIGNYEIGKEKGATGAYVVLRTVRKDWSIRWRDDTLTYGMMMSMVGSKGSRDYLHSLITMMYVASSYPHDLVSLYHNHGMPFMEGFARLVYEQNSYEVSVAPKQPDDKEEEDKAIADAARLEDMQREVEAMEAEESQKKQGDE